MSTGSVDPRPLFVVGCPRSGTTLLQSMLAAHPQIVSFPESHFFNRLISARPWMRRLGLASRMARPRFHAFLREIHHEEMVSLLPWYAITMRQYVRAFRAALNRIAAQLGARYWLEKTPGHLHYIPFIERWMPDACFIHILRDGRDVVASLYEVTHRHPEVWGGAREIEAGIARWQEDVRLSLRYRGRPGHHIVRYEALVEHPRPVLESLCTFLQLPFDAAMLSDYTSAAEALLSEGESWKANVRGALQSRRGRKFRSLFTEAEQRYIAQRVAEVELPALDGEEG